MIGVLVDPLRAGSHIARLHRGMGATPCTANRTLAVVAAMFSWGIRYGLLDDRSSPATRIDKFPERTREWYLSVEEIQRLGDALRRAETVGFTWEPDPSKKVKQAPKNRQVIFDHPAVAAICLLLFTGCRLRKVLHLKWREVDFDRGLLFRKETKTGPKAIVLNVPALDVLQSLPQLWSPALTFGQGLEASEDKPAEQCAQGCEIGRSGQRACGGLELKQGRGRR